MTSKIRLDVDGTSKTFLAEEILAAVLSKMKQNARSSSKVLSKMQCRCFNYEQRQAVCTAAKIAGLTVLRLMHEPSAIAIACDLYSNEKGQKIMLILDFGGGTCTASVILIENGIYECLIDDIDFYSTITRARFNELCADLFRNILDLLEKALRDAKMDKSNIGEIILFGGSSRIPRIQQLLSEFFPGKQLNKKLHPEEAVAYGAAVQAACLSGEKSELLENMLCWMCSSFFGH
uniref:Heat shock protein 70 n=1 Tax=Ditylenchus dipsaci TaxID=166011 RepID=A0A915E3V9_9BILA